MTKKVIERLKRDSFTRCCSSEKSEKEDFLSGIRSFYYSVY